MNKIVLLLCLLMLSTPLAMAMDFDDEISEDDKENHVFWRSALIGLNIPVAIFLYIFFKNM